MDAAVVELDALADPVGAAAQDHHRGPLERRDLVLVLVGGVVVRRAGGELGGAGVDRLEVAATPGGEAGRPHGVWVHAPQVGQLGVGEAEPLGPAPVGPAQRRGAAGLDEARPLLGDGEASGRGTRGRRG